MLFARRGIDTYTKLCLNRPLANNSTSFLDGSLYNRPVNAYGDTRWSNGATKFGNSIYFDGEGDYLSVADSDDFELSNNLFTLDAWINMSALPGTGQVKMIFAKWLVGPGVSYWFGFYNSGGNLNITFRYSTDGIGSPVLGFSVPLTGFSTGVWEHFALVRSESNMTRTYRNGLSIGSHTDDYTIYSGTLIQAIGGSSAGDSNFINAYIAMPRISKGIARWTSNFTPPGNPYV